MARFDRIKNITGLIEAFGLSDILKSNFNLIFAAGSIDPMASSDHEERNEINKAHELISRYKLEGRVRWLPSVNKIDTGEVYRIIADYKGIFVQPALFEAFGLTILEAMLSGLPTFGPVFGGPSEIIEHGKSGYLINTSKPELIAKALEEFHRDSSKHKELWQNISESGVTRVRENYTWKLYSSSLIKQTKLYGFWRFSVAEKGKEEMDRYSDVLYHFLFKERAEKLKR
jgi:sucrose synthase